MRPLECPILSNVEDIAKVELMAIKKKICGHVCNIYACISDSELLITHGLAKS